MFDEGAHLPAVHCWITESVSVIAMRHGTTATNIYDGALVADRGQSVFAKQHTMRAKSGRLCNVRYGGILDSTSKTGGAMCDYFEDI